MTFVSCLGLKLLPDFSLCSSRVCLCKLRLPKPSTFESESKNRGIWCFQIFAKSSDQLIWVTSAHESMIILQIQGPIWLEHVFKIAQSNLTKMQLVETESYLPQQQALFVHSQFPCLAVHPSGRYMTFQTRNLEIILRNSATGRAFTLFASAHPIQNIIFTHRYLIATHQTCRQLLIFSLKTQKLKTKLTGHRSDITAIAYCRQTQQIASISHDLCLIHSQKCLSLLKTLKCSTSSFTDLCFNQSGDYLATAFKDGNVIFWDVIEWNHKQSAVVGHSQYPRISMMGNAVSVHDGKKLWLADSSKQIVSYKQINPFWQGKIKQVTFINYRLVLSTDQAIFLAELKNQNNLTISSIKRVETNVKWVTDTDYQNTLVVLSQNLKKICFLKVEESKNTIVRDTKSPLTNQGLVCAGGYGTSQGCGFIQTGPITGVAYSKQVQTRVQPLIEGCYADLNEQMSIPKLKQFLKKHHALPDKYRPMAYRHSLKLPVSAASFKELERKGVHPSTELLQSNYPISNGYLNQKFKEIMSLLSHWSPVLAVSECVPSIVFPFVCLLGEDKYLCFEVLYRLFSGPLAFIFQEYPLANSAVLQNMWEILQKEDPQLATHFSAKTISFTKLAWSLLSSLFTTALNRQAFLAIADSVVINSDTPETVIFLCLGYLIFNRKRILSAYDQRTAWVICDQQQTIHIQKYLSLSSKLQQKYAVSLHCTLKQSFAKGGYQPLEYPKSAVKMHETRNNIWLQELIKQKEEEVHRENMLLDLEQLTTKTRREAERQVIEQQAYRLHCQQEKSSRLKTKQVDRSERVKAIEQMMDELIGVLGNQQKGKEVFRQYIPAVENIRTSSDTHLQDLEEKLAKLLTEVRPGHSLRHLASHPTNLIKSNHYTEGVKAAVGAKLAHRLLELDQLAKKNQDVLCENRVMAALK